MPRVKGTTSNLQSHFLRGFRRELTGPAPHQWPPPALLRKWLRKPGFRRALLSIRKTMRFERDLQVLAASLHGARNLHDAVHPATKSAKLPPHAQKASTDLLRLTHQPAAAAAAAAEKPRVRTTPRQTAPPEPKHDPDRREVSAEEAAMRLKHPDCRPEVAIAFFKRQPDPYYLPPLDELPDPGPGAAGPRSEPGPGVNNRI